MQHEILLAMVGLTGDVIVLEGDEDKYRRGATFRVNSMLPEAFISKADRQVRRGSRVRADYVYVACTMLMFT